MLRNQYKHEEDQYLDMIRDILREGSLEEGRNGYTKSLFGGAMRFSLKNNTIPLLTTKKVAWKTCFRELMWFVRGQTDNKVLQKQKVKIWNVNASREFLDSRGLTHLKENDLGPVYGHQWRHFNAKYTTCHEDYTNKGVDQLGNIIKMLKDPSTRTSRRMVMSAWNPCQLDEMALPPCHVLTQFHVTNGKELSCSLYQRSCDIGLGVPFNIASYSFLTHLIAKHCDLVPKDFVYFMGNAHIYDDHFEMLKDQALRTPYAFPTLKVLNKHDTIEEYSLDDIQLENYEYHPPIQMKMRG
jgi:thymidylate synthase